MYPWVSMPPEEPESGGPMIDSAKRIDCGSRRRILNRRPPGRFHMASGRFQNSSPGTTLIDFAEGWIAMPKP
jgi:hypothetical protein